MKNFWLRTICIIISGTAITVSDVGLSAARTASREQLVELERKAKAQELEQKRLQAKSLEVNMEMTKLNNSLVSAAKKIQNNEKNLSKMEDELKRLQDELIVSEEKFNKENQKMAQTISALQNLARKPTEALFVQPLTPVEVIRSAILLREIVPNINQNAEILKNQLDNITAQKKNIEQRVQKIKIEQKSLEKEHANLNVLINKKKSMQKDLDIKAKISKQESQRLASEAGDLRDLVEKIEKEQKIKKQKQEEEKRRLEIKRKEQKIYAKIKAESKDDDTMNSIGEKFLKAKGKLARPAAGAIIISYGEETAKGVTSKGIYIKTRNLAQVVTPFDGTVVFAGQFKGYGNMLIIEHGKGYMSLLSGLKDMDCEIGQLLLAGEPVGQMPATNDAKLYMEIRKDSHPINPEIWLAK